MKCVRKLCHASNSVLCVRYIFNSKAYLKKKKNTNVYTKKYFSLIIINWKIKFRGTIY